MNAHIVADLLLAPFIGAFIGWSAASLHDTTPVPVLLCVGALLTFMVWMWKRAVDVTPGLTDEVTA